MTTTTTSLPALESKEEIQRRFAKWQLYLGFLGLAIGLLMGFLQAMDRLGVDLYDAFQLESYYQGLTLHGVALALVFTFTFGNAFCSVTAMFGRKYRFRSAESVIAEIKEKRPKRIFFYDDNFAANKRRLKRLLQMMIDEGLAMPWGAQVRTDVVRDPELLDLMQRSGCEFVALGLESVSQDTLDHFEKSQTVEDIERALDDASTHAFGQPARLFGEGGSIPFMGMLGERFPDAQFVITGVLGPDANAHGPNEYLHVPTARRLTLAVADLLDAHARRAAD